MRIVSYNILDGGEGRADPLAEVILAQRPDVVALIEADHPGVVVRIASRLNMDVIEGAGKRHGAAILSRFPILQTINHGPLENDLTDCLLQATLDVGGGKRLTVAAMHLHAHGLEADEKIRLRELDVVLRIFKPMRDQNAPHLLAGDFNSNSPMQQIDPQRCKPRTQKEWTANGGMLPRNSVQKILDNGYADLLAESDPNAASTAGSFTTQFPGQRVDYIFAHGLTGACKSAWIEQDRLAKYASDHFPMCAELNWPA